MLCGKTRPILQNMVESRKSLARSEYPAVNREREEVERRGANSRVAEIRASQLAKKLCGD